MRRPITDVSFCEVLVRVAYQVVVLDWRRHKANYAGYPPAAVYALGERLKADGYINLYWTLNQASRWLASGYTLRSWRDELRPDEQMRALHKQRPRGTR